MCIRIAILCFECVCVCVLVLMEETEKNEERDLFFGERAVRDGETFFFDEEFEIKYLIPCIHMYTAIP